MNKEFLSEFDWSKYDNDYKGGNRLISNKKIKGQDNKQICYSREPYAQELFDLLTSEDSKIINKDLVKGDSVLITDIYKIQNDRITVELLGGLTVNVDIKREKKFVQIFGFNTVDEFILTLQNEEYLKKFIDQGLSVVVIESSPTLKISLWQGYLKKIKEEFMNEIKNPSKAYIAKVIEANKGGYFVEVQGVEAFMPGSLAAPNKIIDFQSLVGKEITVMIEDFLVEMNSFIVSNKKYIKYILPKKLLELDLNTKYSGIVTGTSKYGIFVEFEKIFTGLLHNSKMKEETLTKFRAREYHSNDIIEFYINEITKDNRIILTEENPEEKRLKFENFIKENKDKVLEGTIAAIMNFGIIVNTLGLSGLIPLINFKKNRISMKNFVVGDKLKIKILELKDEDKLIFNLFKESKEV